MSHSSVRKVSKSCWGSPNDISGAGVAYFEVFIEKIGIFCWGSFFDICCVLLLIVAFGRNQKQHCHLVCLLSI